MVKSELGEPLFPQLHPVIVETPDGIHRKGFYWSPTRYGLLHKVMASKSKSAGYWVVEADKIRARVK